MMASAYDAHVNPVPAQRSPCVAHARRFERVRGLQGETHRGRAGPQEVPSGRTNVGTNSNQVNLKAEALRSRLPRSGC